MNIEITNREDGSSRYFENVIKVIMHSDQEKTEYFDINFNYHPRDITGFCLVTDDSEIAFSNKNYFISRSNPN